MDLDAGVLVGIFVIALVAGLIVGLLMTQQYEWAALWAAASWFVLTFGLNIVTGPAHDAGMDCIWAEQQDLNREVEGPSGPTRLQFVPTTDGEECRNAINVFTAGAGGAIGLSAGYVVYMKPWNPDRRRSSTAGPTPHG
jgi:hypothetical protein